MSPSVGESTRQPHKTSFIRRLGPGLITGASDDDPSGIGTYSQAGAAYGFGLLWTLLLTLPLMAAIQEISARIGRVSGQGIAGNMRRHYPAWVVYPIVFLLLAANTFNLGADLGAMGDALALLIGGPALLYTAVFAVGCTAMMVLASYSTCSGILKWLTLTLLAYVLTAFAVHFSWKSALAGTLIPSLAFTKDYWATVIAIAGTTISPYLFFWQASQETEEIHAHDDEHALKKAPQQATVQLDRIRVDTYFGMAVSNVVAYFIMLSAAATLHVHGVTDVQTSAQAAQALAPLAGKSAATIFSLGIIGTGLLAVPVLAGSAAYAAGAMMHLPIGMDKKVGAAKIFYGCLAAVVFVGLLMSFPTVQRHTHLSPIQALFWSAVINGIVDVPIMVVIMAMFHSRKVMGQFARGYPWLKTAGWLATAVMFAAAMGLFVTWKR